MVSLLPSLKEFVLPEPLRDKNVGDTEGIMSTNALTQRLSTKLNSVRYSLTASAYAPFLPRLERLDLQGRGRKDNLSWMQFKEMVQSRWRTPEAVAS
jgi:hypothetical protein